MFNLKVIFLFFIVFIALFNGNAFSQKKRNEIVFEKDTNRILYAGYDHQIVVEKGAFLTGNVSIHKQNDTLYVIKIASNLIGKFVELTSKINGKETKRKYKCARLPMPVLLLGTLELSNDKSYSKRELTSMAKFGLKFGYTKDVMIYTNITKSISCEIVLIVNGVEKLSEKSNDGKFSKKMLDLMNNLGNYSLKISDIIYTSTNNIQLKSENVEVKVK